MKNKNILLVVGIIILIFIIAYFMFEIIVIKNKVNVNKFENTMFSTYILELKSLEAELKNNEISFDEYEKDVKDADENYRKQIENLGDMKKSLGIFYN